MTYRELRLTLTVNHELFNMRNLVIKTKTIEIKLVRYKIVVVGEIIEFSFLFTDRIRDSYKRNYK